MAQCSSRLCYQLPNDLTIVGKLICSVESLEPKLLAEIAKIDTDEDLKLDFEAMEAYILPWDPIDNNKDYLNKN